MFALAMPVMKCAERGVACLAIGIVSRSSARLDHVSQAVGKCFRRGDGRAVDGSVEESYGIGLEWEGGRSGYRIPVSDGLLARLSAGRRLEIRAGERRLRAVDLAGAGPAVAALRACHDEAAAAMPPSDNIMDMNLTNAM